MHQELLFFCRTFLAGVCLAVSYDILRIFRNLVIHSTAAAALEDLLYWCSAGFFLFSVIYTENDGNIRIYALLAICLGAFTYHVGPSDILVNFISFVLKKIGKFLGILGKPIRKWRKRLKFWLNRVKISLCQQKSIQKIRKRKNEKKKEKKSAEQNRNA